MRWIVLMLATGWLLAGGPGHAQLADRDRVESEARGQAAEADRLFKKGEYAVALPLYEAERASRAALGDLRYEAYAARAMGCCLAELGQIDDAIDVWRATLALDAQRADKGFEGYDWLLIGNLELRRERLPEAVTALERALPLLSKAIDRDHEADARRLLARALAEQGRPEAARPHLDRAWSLARELSDAKRCADVAGESGRVALLLDEPGLAVEWLLDARSEYQGLQLATEADKLTRPLCLALIDLGRADAAAALTEESLQVHERESDFAALADDLGFLAALKSDAGDLSTARAVARRAVTAFRDADDPVGEREALVLLARYESLSGDWSQAAATLAPCLKLVRRDGSPDDQVGLLVLAADVERQAGHAAKSTELLDEAQAVAQRFDPAALIQAVAAARLRAK